jgi:hypothetical protein
VLIGMVPRWISFSLCHGNGLGMYRTILALGVPMMFTTDCSVMFTADSSMLLTTRFSLVATIGWAKMFATDYETSFAAALARSFANGLGTSVAAELERGQTCFFADVIAAVDRLIAGERVHHEPVWRGGVELDAEAAVDRTMPRPRRQHLAAADDAAERTRQGLQGEEHKDLGSKKSAGRTRIWRGPR